MAVGLMESDMAMIEQNSLCLMSGVSLRPSRNSPIDQHTMN